MNRIFLDNEYKQRVFFKNNKQSEWYIRLDQSISVSDVLE